MKLSDIDERNLKKGKPEKVEGRATIDILDVLSEEGISTQDPGLETRKKAEYLFKRELEYALSDPNLCILIYSGILLEREGRAGNLPNISKSSYEKDMSFIIADEVLGTSIATYISGSKGAFEFVRYDKQKPGILSNLGPFIDDVIGGLIGGVSSSMYSRGLAEFETKDWETGEIL
jgi:alpha-ribazole phosphatase CobZ